VRGELRDARNRNAIQCESDLNMEILIDVPGLTVSDPFVYFYWNEALSLFGIGCLHHLKGIVQPERKSHYLLTLMSSPKSEFLSSMKHKRCFEEFVWFSWPGNNKAE